MGAIGSPGLSSSNRLVGGVGRAIQNCGTWRCIFEVFYG